MRTIELGDIEYIIKHLTDTIELLPKIKNGTEKDNYYQINLINKLFKKINLRNNEKLVKYNKRKLNDRELLEIQELKLPLCRLYLLEEFSKNKGIFSGNIKSFMIKDNLSNLTDNINDFYNLLEIF